MMKTLGIRGLVLAAALTISSTACTSAMAGSSCVYKGSTSSDGGSMCQAGTLHRCDDGKWESLSRACDDVSAKAIAPACILSGISYSPGSSSCQAGTQKRCDDGAWISTGLTCTVGDVPMRAVGGTRTCMLNDVTVASNSTVCKAGVTFLCADGDWANVGTACR